MVAVEVAVVLADAGAAVLYFSRAHLAVVVQVAALAEAVASVAAAEVLLAAAEQAVDGD